MPIADDDLRRMKERRRELIRDFGDKGQRHHMASMIGGLNPAAQELHRLRGDIARAERDRRGPTPRLTMIEGREERRGYGLKFYIDYQGKSGKLGTDSNGRWYVVVGEGPDSRVVADNFKTKGEATKAFVKYGKEPPPGAVLCNETV